MDAKLQGVSSCAVASDGDAAGPAAVPVPVPAVGDATVRIDSRVPQENRAVIGQLRLLLATYHQHDERLKVKHLKNLINYLKLLVKPLGEFSDAELRKIPDVNQKTVPSARI